MEELERLAPWYHSVQVGDYVTPGKVDPTIRARTALDHLEDVAGRRVLDVGGNCGGVAFEFARHGADITVLEGSARYIEQGETLARLLNLNVDFRRGSVYDAEQLGGFDIVLLFGVIYHLRHPFRVLDIIRRVTRDRLLISSRYTASKHHVWAMGNVLGKSPPETLSGELAHNWWLPSLDGMEATLSTYGWTDVRLLDDDADRREAFWSASPDPALAGERY